MEINSGDIPDFSEKMRDAAKSVSRLQEEIQQTQKDLGILAARGDQNSDNFKTMQGHLSKLQTQLKNTNKEMKFYTESIDINLMSSNQLNARSKVLANTLNALSKEAEPDRWNELNDELIKVRRRMDEVRVGTLGVSDSMDITGMSMQQLDVYSRQLKARLAAIPRDAANSPEWNRLKKRLDEVTAEQKKAVTSMSSELSGMFKRIGWTSVITGAASLFKKFAQDVVVNSNAIGDKWNRTMAGMRTAYQALLTTFATGDWTHLFSNMSRAFIEGRKLEEMMEALYEYQNAGKLSSVRNEIEIAAQESIMRDSSASSQEKFDASGKVIELQTENLKTKLRAAELARQGALEAIRLKSDLSANEIEAMVDNYFNNEDLINAASKYIELGKELDALNEILEERFGGVNNSLLRTTDFYKEMSEESGNIVGEMQQMIKSIPGLGTYVSMLKRYDLLNDENINQYVEAQSDYLQAFADYNRDISRAQRTRNKMMQDMASERLNNAVASVNLEAQEEENIYKQKFANREISEEELTAELKRIAEDRLQKIIAVTQQEYDNAVAMTNKVAEEEKRAAQEKFNNRIISETELSRELERIENDRQQGLNGVYELFRPELASATSDFLNNITDTITGMEAAATGSEEALDGALQKAQEVNAEQEKMLDQSLEAANAAVQEDMDFQGGRLASDVEQAGRIRTQFADKSTRLGMLAYDKDAEMAQLRSLYDQGLVTEEEYQKARVDIIRRYARQAREIQSEGWEEGLQAASNILNGMATMVSSIQEAEAASLDAQMQKELAAAGSSADQRAAIEEKYEAKKLALQKKYANINMGIQIAQTIAAGALAIMQALAQLGPVAGGIMAGVIAATTAAQVAVIVAQRNAVMNSTAAGSSDSASVRMVTGGDSGSGGYSEGGFTGYGGRLEPAGIVHRGEYVVPVPEMRNPEAYSHVMAIERIRSRRSHRNPLPGFADGGYTGRPSYSTDAALGSMMSELRALRRNPIKAYVVLSELDAQRALRDTHLKAGSRR